MTEEQVKIICGDCLEELDKLEANSIGSIVTDPPYELNFMGKGWDNAGVSFQKETWEKCLRVLKPGGYLLAFGGSRTFHRIAVAIEDAGFEVRDTIMWLYGSGFPKSLNLGVAVDKKNGVESEVIGTGKSGDSSTHTRTMHSETLDGKSVFGGEFEIKRGTNKWAGWGTALKPSYEPIIVARKPVEGTNTDNVIKWGVGGINIDECRVGNEERTIPVHSNEERADNTLFGLHPTIQHERTETEQGRFPANTILTYGEEDFEEVCGGFPNTHSKSQVGKVANPRSEDGVFNRNSCGFNNTEYFVGKEIGYNDSGSACRYFYCAKASKKDREEGCDSLEDGIFRRTRPDKDDNNPTGLNKEGRFAPVVRKNTHPTVKPTELMQYLVRLVTPKGETILDPFMRKRQYRKSSNV